MRQHYELLRSTSRTFAVGIEALPRELRDAVTLAYLVLRVSDYFEDSPSLPASERARLLLAWAELLDPRTGKGADGTGLPRGAADPALTRTPDERYAPLLERVSAEDRGLPDHAAALRGAFILADLGSLPPRYRTPILRHTAETTRGMADWVLRGDDFPDEAAMDAYMFEVAGRVGVLLTELFEAYSPRISGRSETLREKAVSFGLGLQTVNVIRGLHEDPSRGWTFLPRILLPAPTSSDPRRSEEPASRAGDPERVSAADRAFLDPRALPETDRARILDFLVAKAGRHLADAFGYCLALPRRERGIRIFCILPALLAVETASRSRGNLEVFRGPVKVERTEVRRTVLRTRLLFFSDSWLRRKREGALDLARGR